MRCAYRNRNNPNNRNNNVGFQFWANVYLNAFDHFVMRELRCQAYLRYVDDLLFFHNDKATLWSWKEPVEERLAQLRVTIHAGSHPRPVSEGIPFLGFVTYPDRRRLKRRKGIHFQRKLRDLRTSYRRREIPLAKLSASILGWVNHVRYGNTVGLRKAVLRKSFPRENRPGGSAKACTMSINNESPQSQPPGR